MKEWIAVWYHLIAIFVTSLMCLGIGWTLRKRELRARHLVRLAKASSCQCDVCKQIREDDANSAF
jgi:hypothetical protein